MSGNVYEWCWDLYTNGKEIEEDKNYDLDPKGQAVGVMRVVRGGCWNLNARSCEVVFRNFSRPWSKIDFSGTRLVKN